MEDANLNIFKTAGWLRAITVEVIIEEQLSEGIKQKCPCQKDGKNLYLVDEAVNRVAMKLHILEAQVRVWTES